MKRRFTQNISPVACRICGDVADALTNWDAEGPPRDGDYNVCINCGALSVYHEGAAQEPTPAEREKAPSDAIKAAFIIKMRGRIR